MTILVADDDSLFRSLLKRFLMAEAAVSVVWEAQNGEEATLAAEARRPDLVIVDMALLRISGLEVTRLLKSKHPEMKVVVLSGYHEQAYERAALESGADAYYPKSKCREVLQHLAEGQTPPSTAK